MSDPAFLAQLQGQIEPHLKRIEKVLPREYKLTLICRYTGPKTWDADVVLTLDDLFAVAQVAARFAEKQK